MDIFTEKSISKGGSLTWSNERVPFIDIAKRFFSNKTWTNEKVFVFNNWWINLVEKMNLKVVWMKLGRPLFKQDPIFCSVVLIRVIHILEKTFKYSLWNYTNDIDPWWDFTASISFSIASTFSAVVSQPQLSHLWLNYIGLFYIGFLDNVMWF